jgi:hypothetical protein
MITIYKVFQLILGIIISGFILLFLIQYASDYADFGGTKQKITVMNNLKETVNGVYFSGNPIVFPDTDSFDLSSCEMRYEEEDAPFMSCEFGEVYPVLLPTLPNIREGEKVVVDVESIDYGWWEARFVTVLPETHIIFNPIDASDQAWDTMTEITRLLPPTESFGTKVTFTFCDGIVLNVCGGESCEKRDFLSVLRSTSNTPALKCTESVGGKYRPITYSLITVSQSCSPGFVSQGICIKPDLTTPGIGRIYTPRDQDIFIYKDPADIVSLLIGGDKEDPFRKSGAEKLYEYKNSVFSERLYLAARVMAERAHLLKSKYQEECFSCLDQQCGYCVCHPLYDSLEKRLEDVMGKAGGDHTNYLSMENLKSSLNQASSVHQELVNRGCEL